MNQLVIRGSTVITATVTRGYSLSTRPSLPVPDTTLPVDARANLVASWGLLGAEKRHLPDPTTRPQRALRTGRLLTMLERIDHMICVVPDLAVASAAYERLGLVLTPAARQAETGAANRACFVGTSEANYCYLELLAVVDERQARASGRAHYVEASARGGGALGLAFGTGSISAEAARLSTAGHATAVETVHRQDGTKVCDVAPVAVGDALPFSVSLIAYPETWEARYRRSREAGRFSHAFPLKRLDHLAAIAPDLEATTMFWTETLAVPVFGEIRTPQMVIRQLKIGDAILELLGPASPDSPLAGRPASFASMAAWEVAVRLEDAVTLARERGFTCSDPEAGVIPGTRRASIPAVELGGVGMQLLEYV